MRSKIILPSGSNKPIEPVTKPTELFIGSYASGYSALKKVREEINLEKENLKSLGKVTSNTKYYFEEKEAIPHADAFLETFWSDEANIKATQKAHEKKYRERNRGKVKPEAVPPSCVSFVLTQILNEQICFIAISGFDQVEPELKQQLDAHITNLNKPYQLIQELQPKPGEIVYKKRNDSLEIKLMTPDGQPKSANIPLCVLQPLPSSESEILSKRQYLDQIVNYLYSQEVLMSKYNLVKYEEGHSVKANEMMYWVADSKLNISVSLEDGTTKSGIISWETLKPTPSSEKEFLENNDLYSQQILAFLYEKNVKLSNNQDDYKLVQSPKLKLAKGDIYYNEFKGALQIHFINKMNETKSVSIPLKDLEPEPLSHDEFQNDKDYYLTKIVEILSAHNLNEENTLKYALVGGTTINFSHAVTKAGDEEPLKNCSEKYYGLILAKLYGQYGENVFVKGVTNYHFYPIDATKSRFYGDSSKTIPNDPYSHMVSVTPRGADSRSFLKMNTVIANRIACCSTCQLNKNGIFQTFVAQQKEGQTRKNERSLDETLKQDELRSISPLRDSFYKQ